MNRIRRWSMSITSWVDGMLAQIENHEAAVNGAISRVRQSTARARVQLRRVERDQRVLRETLAHEQRAAELWRDRASRTGDESSALECLRRYKTAERRLASLRERLDEHERAHKELTEGVGVLSQRLGELTERKNLMRTRQSRAEAAHGMVCAGAPMGDLEDVFERWESRVGEIEIASECAEPIDAFEREFYTAEEEAALLIELAELREGNKGEAP